MCDKKFTGNANALPRFKMALVLWFWFINQQDSLTNMFADVTQWRPRCQGKPRDDVSGRIILKTENS